MLQSSTIQFLKKLEKNNSKPWFDANRHLYESAKADFLSLTAAVLKETAKFDASIAHPRNVCFASTEMYVSAKTKHLTKPIWA
jgi:uncharacterized protein (DUF2461 family)